MRRICTFPVAVTAVLFATLGFTTNIHADRPEKPNIIWIMSDDLSLGDLGCYGQKLIKTPNIDRLAKAGMRFTQCYSGSTVCAPSRSSLMQGLHQGHATVRNNMVNGYRHSLQPDDVTVAEILRRAGYRTGLFGKWGLGLSGQPGVPWMKGFDEFFGYLNQRKAHSFYPDYLWDNDKKVLFPQHAGHNHRVPSKYDAQGRVIPTGIKDPSKAVYSADLIADKSLDFIRRHKDRPFFLYLAYTPPHGPLIAPELGQYTNKKWSQPQKEWAAMVTRMDKEVGRVLDLLAELKLDRKTIVFFCSDNGYSALGYTSDLDELFRHWGPFRGRKGNLLEGGVRVPMIVSWPGQIPAGKTNDHIWAFWDFLPTACELAKVAAPKNIDGISVLPTLLGEGKQKEHEYLYWEFRNEQAVRMGKWKAYQPHPQKATQLYIINEDPKQKTDLAKKYPGVVKRAETIFREAHTQSPVFPAPGESTQAWRARLKNAGTKLPRNVDG